METCYINIARMLHETVLFGAQLHTYNTDCKVRTTVCCLMLSKLLISTARLVGSQQFALPKSFSVEVLLVESQRAETFLAHRQVPSSLTVEASLLQACLLGKESPCPLALECITCPVKAASGHPDPSGLCCVLHNFCRMPWM